MAEAKAERLVIKGSDTLGAKLVPQLAESFPKRNILVLPSTLPAEGSTTGIAAIIDGTAEIRHGQHARAKSSESGRRPRLKAAT